TRRLLGLSEHRTPRLQPPPRLRRPGRRRPRCARQRPQARRPGRLPGRGRALRRGVRGPEIIQESVVSKTAGTAACRSVAMRPDDPYDPAFDAPAKEKAAGKPRRRWFLEWLAVLVILAPFWLFLWWPIRTSPNYGKPLGREIPTEPPDEANRVVHPQGF